MEHQGSVSPGAFPTKVHLLKRVPRNLNGKTHALPGSPPPTVVQPAGDRVVVVETTGHSDEQNPHLPCPPWWSSFELVNVEHHGSVSPGALPSKAHSL